MELDLIRLSARALKYDLSWGNSDWDFEERKYTDRDIEIRGAFTDSSLEFDVESRLFGDFATDEISDADVKDLHSVHGRIRTNPSDRDAAFCTITKKMFLGLRSLQFKRQLGLLNYTFTVKFEDKIHSRNSPPSITGPPTFRVLEAGPFAHVKNVRTDVAALGKGTYSGVSYVQFKPSFTIKESYVTIAMEIPIRGYLAASFNAMFYSEAQLTTLTPIVLVHAPKVEQRFERLTDAISWNGSAF